MALFSSTQPSLRARMLPRFPAQVLAGNGMTITKSGNTYVFAANAYADIPLTAFADIGTDRLLGRDSPDDGPPEELTVSGGLGFDGAGGLTLTANQRLRTLQKDITGSPITTGIKADIHVPFSCTISRVTLLADQSGNMVLDIWKDTYANYPPLVGDSITAAAKPTLAAASKYEDGTLTGWTTAINAGDILRLNVDSVATVTRVHVCLDVVML